VKLLHVITGLNVGGAETMLARLLEHRGVDPSLEPEVVSLMEPGFIGPRIVATGVPCHSLGMRSAAHAPGAALRLAALVRRRRPDAIMGWMHHGQLAASFASRVSSHRPPVIWNVRHSLNQMSREKPLTRAILRFEAYRSRSPATIIYNSRTASEQYRAIGFHARRELVIPNGFDMSCFAGRATARAAIARIFGIAQDIPLIGMIARAHPMKDLPNLIHAFARVHGAGERAHLLIVGDGMDRLAEPAAALAQALPRARLTLSGQRGDVPQWLAGLDMLVLPSAWGEGFPNIVGEAMAAGVPCIATDVGDAAWLIGSTGYIVPPEDSPALAAAIIRMLALGVEGRARLGAAARTRIKERFTLDDIARTYAALCVETMIRAEADKARRSVAKVALL
jgi:glycosyltransferase involved in cell wall biosynthesis